MNPSLYSVAIFVNDIGRAIELYRDGLQLPLTKQGSFGAEFLEGETHIGVLPAVHTEAKSLVGKHKGITTIVPGLLHYCGEWLYRGVRFTTEPTQQSLEVMNIIVVPEVNPAAIWEMQLPE